MTVQISVTVWTILSFLALMLVLDRLLFRPLLAFMDKRQAKIDTARQAREAAQRQREEALRRQQEERIAAERQALVDANAALEAARQDNARRIAEKRAEIARRMEEERRVLDEESQSMYTQLGPHFRRLAAIFANRLQTWQTQKEDRTEVEETAAPYAPAVSPVSAPKTTR